MTIDYSLRKALNAETRRCIYAGCERECLDDHLMCEPHGEDHRRRNRVSTRQRRQWRRLQLWIGFDQ
jgi:hypothetical protein